VLAVGGDHVSNDLAYGLKVSLGRAEQLKVEHGAARVTEQDKGSTLSHQDEHGLPLKTVNLEHLRRIMGLRLEETFELIEAQLSQAGLLDYLRAGVVLCGGGARVPGIQQLAEDIFQLPTQLGKSNSISGLQTALDQPEFTTAIGLAKYGSFQQKRRTGRSFFKRAVRETFGGLLSR
jgi:cell division protein FtsA